MSGVYIPNMKMPESCDVCWAEYAYEICNSHSEHCPLIPVPDHGRLIDADAMLEKHYSGNEKHITSASVITPQMVSSLPTIIPADKEAGE